MVKLQVAARQVEQAHQEGAFASQLRNQLASREEDYSAVVEQLSEDLLERMDPLVFVEDVKVFCW